MTIIAERISSPWFDRLTTVGHPELVEGVVTYALIPQLSETYVVF